MFGGFVTASYRASGACRANGSVRLAVNAHLVLLEWVRVVKQIHIKNERNMITKHLERNQSYVL